MALHYYNQDKNAKIAVFFTNLGVNQPLNGPPVRGGLVGVTVSPGDVVFSHGGPQNDWITFARENPYVDVVFMTTVPPIELPKDAPSNAHVCGYPADHLSDHTRVGEFFNDLQNSDSREWHLLSPEPYPENLVALYLLDIARDKLENPDIGNEIVKEIMYQAKDEYMERMNDSELPDDASERIKAVRELFVRVASQ